MHALYRWFWRLLPANPMVVRIVHNGSSRTRDLWVRMGYLGVLVLIVLISLLSGSGLAGEVSLTELAKNGTRIFAVVSYGQIILVCLLAPLFMASAIGAEQQGKTFDILLTTPLSNLQIVLGSLMGRLFFILALLLSGLPLFAVLLIFGGVRIGSVVLSFAIAGLTALFVGSIAITLSVLRIGGRRAIFSFVIVVVAYLLAAYALDVAVVRRLDPTPHTTWLTPLHPLLVLESTINTANYSPPPPDLLADRSWIARLWLGQPATTFTILTFITSITLVTWCGIVLRRVGQSENKAVRWLRAKLRLGYVGERKRKARSVTGSNPIAWRESHTRGNAAGGILMRWGFVLFAIGLGGIFLLLHHADRLPRIPALGGGTVASAELFRSALLALVLLEVAIITLVAIYMSAGCVSREREDGTLDIFLTTPMTPKQYIWGKLRGLVQFLSLLIAVPVGTLALVSVYTIAGQALGWQQATVMTLPIGSASRISTPLVLPEAPLLLAVMLVPFIALCVAVGMGWSLKARGVLGAVVPTIAIIGVLSLVLGLCGWQMARQVEVLGAVINAFSPTTNLAMIVSPWDTVAGFANRQAASRITLGFGALIAAGGYSLLVYTLILSMVRGFDQTVRRLSGTG